MKKGGKEEYNSQTSYSTHHGSCSKIPSFQMSNSSQNSQKSSKYSPIQHMDRVLSQMQQAFKANIETQECYIDIINRKDNTINSHDIKKIYAMVSNRKANEICMEKEIVELGALEFDDRLLRRYYARIIQMGIKKISYFWTHCNKLEFISSNIAKFSKKIYLIFSDIFRIKGLDNHYTIIEMLQLENAAIEQKIYQFLIDEGYLLSMDEFYRINGVDLIGDCQLEAKYSKQAEQSFDPSLYHSEEIIQPKKESHKNIRITKKKDLKSLLDNKSSQLQSSLKLSNSKSQLESNKTKIKNMFENLVKELKNTISNEKKINLEVIQEELDGNIKIQAQSFAGPKLNFKEQLLEESTLGKNISHRKSSRTECEIRKKMDKKLSIELMSYFSNDLKLILNETKESDISNFSSLIVTSKSKSMEDKPPNDICIHSMRSIESLRLIKEQKKRSKLIEIVSSKKNDQNLENLSQEVHQYNNEQNMIAPRAIFHRSSQLGNQKIIASLFHSSPFKYSSRFGPVEKNLCNKKQSMENNSSRFLLKHNPDRDSIFKNEVLINELSPKTYFSINQTEINGSSLSTGIMSQNAWRKYKEDFGCYNNGIVGKISNDRKILPINDLCQQKKKKLEQLSQTEVNTKKLSELKRQKHERVKSYIQENIASEIQRQKKLIASQKLTIIKVDSEIRRRFSRVRMSIDKSEKSTPYKIKLLTVDGSDKNNQKKKIKRESSSGDLRTFYPPSQKESDKESPPVVDDLTKRISLRVGRNINYTVYDTVRRRMLEFR